MSPARDDRRIAGRCRRLEVRRLGGVGGRGPSLSGVSRGEAYDDRWRRMAMAGQWPHGEADLVCWFKPVSVLDAGCGTGRVAVELHRRGVHVVGVDRDSEMLATARSKAPHLTWIRGDLVDVSADGAPVAADDDAAAVADPATGCRDDGRRDDVRGWSGFDVVVMAGNVMVFVVPGTEAAVVANMAAHLRPGGRLVAGFQLIGGGLSLDDYDRFAVDAGLVLEHRWSTWDREAYAGGGYAVSVHRSRGVGDPLTSPVAV